MKQLDDVVLVMDEPNAAQNQTLHKKEEAAAKGVLRDRSGAGVFHRYLACVALQQRPLRHGEPAGG